MGFELARLSLRPGEVDVDKPEGIGTENLADGVHRYGGRLTGIQSYGLPYVLLL
jgi:hypothetical protein